MELQNSDITVEKKKKTYSAPDLIEYGKLGEMTQGTGEGITDANFSSAFT